MRFKKLALSTFALTAICAAIPSLSVASSHREAPFITTSPKVDGTDFYMFRSYEANKSDFVTLIANYQPLQDAYGGPNYFKMDQNALYEIHIDNNGDAKEDITFQFRFKNTSKDKQFQIGGATGPNVSIPLTQFGVITADDGIAGTNLNVNETFTVNVVRGDRRTGTSQPVTKMTGGSATFEKPSDYIGFKTNGDKAAYAAYAGKHVHNINIPGCSIPGRVFVGQRQEGFAVNLGVIFDLVNATAGNLTGARDAFQALSIQDKNVTSLAVEVAKDCLTATTAATGPAAVIGGWTTASMRQGRLLNGAPASGLQASEKAGGAWVQVSRLGNPLVNEVVIGLKDKDKFNASKPTGDAQFATYVTNPTLPALLNAVLGAPVVAPTNFPRTDLVTTFLTGITGINKPANVVASEMLRLNTDTAAVAEAGQNTLGVLGNALAGGTDNAGFPNGRRPKDDVVDIALIAVLGGLCNANVGNGLGLNTVTATLAGGPLSLTSDCSPTSVPMGATSYAVHDAVDQKKVAFLPGFPYLNTPNPGVASLQK